VNRAGARSSSSANANAFLSSVGASSVGASSPLYPSTAKHPFANPSMPWSGGGSSLSTPQPTDTTERRIAHGVAQTRFMGPSSHGWPGARLPDVELFGYGRAMAKTASKAKTASQAKTPSKKPTAPRAKTAPKKTIAAKATRFEGFPPGAMHFWHELASEMSKAWFDANKARYEAEWVTPMKALLEEVSAGIAPAYKPLTLAEPKVMRIHRDVRFSKNKAPYKTHIGGVITLGGSLAAGGSAAMYVHVGIDEQFVGVGSYMFDPPRLARWRSEVDGKAGVELQRLVGGLRKAGYVVGGHDDYKKVPAGFDADHPRAELLKMKGLTGAFPSTPEGLLFEPGFASFLIEHGKATAPLVKWLARHVP